MSGARITPTQTGVRIAGAQLLRRVRGWLLARYLTARLRWAEQDIAHMQMELDDLPDLIDAHKSYVQCLQADLLDAEAAAKGL